MMDRQKALILLVDDIPNNVNLLVSILEPEYEIAIATNGSQALKMVLEMPPDLILLDVMMPDIDGFEVCRRLKKNMATHKIPVIFLTAKTEQEDILRGFEVGGVDYVTKPFQAPELKARVKTHIQLHQLKSFLSICAYCNKIKNEETWEEFIPYLRKKTGTEFSHGVCPNCLKHALEEIEASKPGGTR